MPGITLVLYTHVAMFVKNRSRVLLVEDVFCYNWDQAIISHEVDEPPGKLWLATATLDAVPLPVVTWEVAVLTYPDVDVGFVANL